MTATVIDLAVIRRERESASSAALATALGALSAGTGGYPGADRFPTNLTDDDLAFLRWVIGQMDEDNRYSTYDDGTPAA